MHSRLISIEHIIPKRATMAPGGDCVFFFPKESTSLLTLSLLFLLPLHFLTPLKRISPAIYLWHGRPRYRQEDERNVCQARGPDGLYPLHQPTERGRHVRADKPPPRRPSHAGLHYSSGDFTQKTKTNNNGNYSH